MTILKNDNQNIFQPMNTNLKNQYVSPRTDVLDVRIEGIICESPTSNMSTPAGYGGKVTGEEIDGD